MTAEVLRFAPKSEEKDGRIWIRVSHNLVLHRPSGIFYARKFKAGKGRFFQSTGLTKKGLAQTKADVMIAEWMGGKNQAGKRIRMERVIDELDEILEAEAHQRDEHGRVLRRKRTRDKDRTYFPIIKKHFGDLFPDEIDEAYWKRWVLTDGRKLNRTLGDIAKYLSKVLTYAFERKLIGRKPRIKNPDPRKKTVHTYTPEQIRMFWQHANQDMKDMIVVGGEAGIRPHENKGLRWDWITLPAKGQAKVRIPDDFEKRGIGREIILSKNATEVLRRRWKTGKGPFVFPSPSDPTKPISDTRHSRYWRKAVMAVNEKLIEQGLKPFPIGRKGGVKFHWLRHTFGSILLLEQKRALPEAAAYMGNSPKILFDRYLAKDAAKTKEIADAVSLDFGDEEE